VNQQIKLRNKIVHARLLSQLRPE